MDRETKKFNTPNGAEIEIKAFITGGEARQIQGVFLEGMEMNIENGETKMNGLKGGVVNKAQDKTIELLVCSVNGKKENILDSVLNLRKEDFDFVIQEINKITEGISKKKLN
jgi:hypothetical protein